MNGNEIVVPARKRTGADWLRGEPMLEDLLSDSVLGTLMRSDGVDPAGFRTFLQEMRGRARTRSRRR
jgi:hypothetical protein